MKIKSRKKERKRKKRKQKDDAFPGEHDGMERDKGVECQYKNKTPNSLPLLHQNLKTLCSYPIKRSPP